MTTFDFLNDKLASKLAKKWFVGFLHTILVEFCFQPAWHQCFKLRDLSFMVIITINFFYKEDSDEEDYKEMLLLKIWWHGDEDHAPEQRRNTRRCPGVTNGTGRPEYRNSAFEQMFCDPEVWVDGWAANEMFRRHFHIPSLMYNCQVDWTKPWHEINEEDAVGHERCPT